MNGILAGHVFVRVEAELCGAQVVALYGFLRWVIGLVMIAGGLLLLMTSETDKYALMLRVLSLTAVAVLLVGKADTSVDGAAGATTRADLNEKASIIG